MLTLILLCIIVYLLRVIRRLLIPHGMVVHHGARDGAIASVTKRVRLATRAIVDPGSIAEIK